MPGTEANPKQTSNPLALARSKKTSLKREKKPAARKRSKMEKSIPIRPNIQSRLAGNEKGSSSILARDMAWFTSALKSSTVTNTSIARYFSRLRYCRVETAEIGYRKSFRLKS